MTDVHVAVKPDVRKRVAGELQPVLADLVNLSLLGKQAHWNVVGPFFPPIHEKLDTVVDNARDWADTVAERIVALGIPAQGQVQAVAEGSGLAPLPTDMVSDKETVRLMTERLAATAARARSAVERLGELDLVSQDMLIGVVEGLEKHLWMFRVQLA